MYDDNDNLDNIIANDYFDDYDFREDESDFDEEFDEDVAIESDECDEDYDF